MVDKLLAEHPTRVFVADKLLSEDLTRVLTREQILFDCIDAGCGRFPDQRICICYLI